MQTSSPSFEQTQQLAYHLWRQANCPSGQDLDFWLQAERQIAAAPAVNGAEKRNQCPPGNQPGNGDRLPCIFRIESPQRT